MKLHKITERGGMLVENRIVQKYDTGPGNIDRYVELNSVDLPVVGKVYAVGQCTYVGPNVHTNDYNFLIWSTDADVVREGWPGNSDHKIRKHNGWRGTTNDCAFYGNGARKCVSVNRKEYTKTVHYRICFGADQSQI